jgi:glycosyltransferase involved in cell wall biosynthesis
MENAKLITLGLPVFNDGDALKLTIESILIELKGNEDQVEIIVSDNCSFDNSFKIAQATLGNFPFALVLRQKENLGFAGNLRAIANSSHSEYLWFIGAGDTLVPGKLKEIIEILRSKQFAWGTLGGRFNFQINEPALHEMQNRFLAGSSRTRNNVAVFNHAISLNIFRKSVMADFRNCQGHEYENQNLSFSANQFDKQTIWESDTCFWPHLEAIALFAKTNEDSEMLWFEISNPIVLLDNNKNGNWDQGITAMRIFRQWQQVVNLAYKYLPTSSALKKLNSDLHGLHLLHFTFMLVKHKVLPRADLIQQISRMKLVFWIRLGAVGIACLPHMLVTFLARLKNLFIV